MVEDMRAKSQFSRHRRILKLDKLYPCTLHHKSLCCCAVVLMCCCAGEQNASLMLERPRDACSWLCCQLTADNDTSALIGDFVTSWTRTTKSKHAVSVHQNACSPECTTASPLSACDANNHVPKSRNNRKTLSEPAELLNHWYSTHPCPIPLLHSDLLWGSG